MVRFHELAANYAVEVASLESDGPASRAGVKRGDLLVAINEQVVRSVDDLYRFLSEWQPGAEVTLTLLRHTRKLNLTAMPTEA